MAPPKYERDRLEALKRNFCLPQRYQPAEWAAPMPILTRLALTIEMLAGIGVGGFIGWWMDKVLGTAPIFMLLMLVPGMGAGLMNSVRTNTKMRRKQDALDAARHSAETAQDEE